MARPDPRAEPTSDPPVADESAVQRVAPEPPPKAKSEPPPAKAKSEPPPKAKSEPPPPKAKSEPPPPKKITNVDPRCEDLEKLLDRNDWAGIAALLGPIDDVGKLPPNLGLVASLAHTEGAKEASPEAIAVAIRCMAGLLGVAEDSPIAHGPAPRLLRKNPTRLVDRKAPPAKVSFLIVVLTLVIGGGVGFVLSIGSVQGVLRLLHLHP